MKGVLKRVIAMLLSIVMIVSNCQFPALAENAEDGGCLTIIPLMGGESMSRGAPANRIIRGMLRMIRNVSRKLLYGIAWKTRKKIIKKGILDSQFRASEM